MAMGHGVSLQDFITCNIEAVIFASQYHVTSLIFLLAHRGYGGYGKRSADAVLLWWIWWTYTGITRLSRYRAEAFSRELRPIKLVGSASSLKEMIKSAFQC